MSDDWGNDPLKPMVGSVSKTDLKAVLNKTFGPGKWALTSGYRTPAYEDDLRRKGAGTVPPGHTSAHSEGDEHAPGAYDIVVPGMSQADAAKKLADADSRFDKVFAEGRRGGQGAHIHASVALKVPSAKADDWGNDPLQGGETKPAPAPKWWEAPGHATLRPATNPLVATAREVGHNISDRFGRAAADFQRRDPMGDSTANRLAQAGDVMDMIGAPLGGLFEKVVGPALSPYDPVRRGGYARHDAEMRATGDVGSALTPLEFEGLGVKAGARVATRAAPLSARTIERSARAIEKARMASPEALHAQNVQVLADHGFDARRLTPGQIKGGEARRVEDAAKSKPGLSGPIRAREQDALRELNRTWYDQSLKPIGEKFTGHPQDIGERGVSEVHDKIAAVYDKWLPRAEAKADAPFTDEIKAIRARDTKVHGPYQGALSTIIDEHVMPRFENGVMTGASFKKVESELGSLASGYRQKGERLLAEHVDDLSAALRDNIERNSPPGVRDKIKSANTSWAIYKRLEAAAGRNARSGGVASSSDFLQSVKKLDRSKDKGVFARGDALMQPLAKAGDQVLKNVVADSGTTERAMRNSRGIAGELIGGAIGSHGGPIGAAAGAAVGGTVDRALGGVQGLVHGRLMRHQVERAARRMSAAGPHAPVNNLKAILGRVNPALPHHLAMGGLGVNGLGALMNAGGGPQ